MYLLEFGSESLKIFENTPQIGDVITIQEKEKLANLFKYLEKEVDKRKQLFSEYNGNINDYNRLNPDKKVPLILMLV
jgi:S-DNA-T family DNA segregation ATPase FtsK/SpoIIIE